MSATLQHYIDGAKSGEGDDMKPAFHKDATIFGYAGADLFAGPIQQLFAWNDNNGPATGLYRFPPEIISHAVGVGAKPSRAKR